VEGGVKKKKKPPPLFQKALRGLDRYDCISV